MNTKLPLTARQRQVCYAILDLMESNGFSPTWRELMPRLGIRSKNGILCHLLALEKKGALWIDRNPDGLMRPRGLQLTPAIAEPVPD